MAEVTLPGAWHTLTLDVCGRCALIWFDASEYEALPRAPEPEPVPVEATMSPEAREQLALYRVQQIGEQARRESFNDGPEQSWQWLPAILGLPVELDAPAVSRRPWATWALVALCVLTTVPLLLADVPIRDEIYQQWGFVPAEWARGGGATLLTSFLLHGGLFHLIGNMYFLMVFGDNVEDRLGRVAYLGLLAGGHLLGMLAQGLFGPDATVPCVGASAGIGGVIACYAIQFPQVRLGFMFRFHFLFRWFHLSAAWALVLFILMQAAGAYFQLRGFGAVSYLGHLGGLSVGLTLALVHRAQQRRDVDRAIGLESR
jgi:membrane associated rhomboid family serine protease